MLIDEIYYHILAYPSYILMLAVLLATLFIGTEVNGAKSCSASADSPCNPPSSPNLRRHSPSLVT